MKNTFLVLMLSVIGHLGFAKTLVISDIDDTIKTSHVNSWVAKYAHAHRTDNPFLYMADLYSSIQADFVYVTNAPASVMRRAHSQFLIRNQFPPGELHMRPGVFSVKDKFPMLEKVIREKQPSVVIFFGDNGEKDPIAYKLIQEAFPEIEFHTFIRWVYDPDQESRFWEDQVPFVTAGEVALHLYELGLIPQDSVMGLVQAGAIQMGLPHWVDCRGHRPEFDVAKNWQEQTRQMENSIRERCR